MGDVATQASPSPELPHWEARSKNACREGANRIRSSSVARSRGFEVLAEQDSPHAYRMLPSDLGGVGGVH